jgi:hypothetical protein
VTMAMRSTTSMRSTTQSRSKFAPPPAAKSRREPAQKPEPKLLFQRFFKSVGPRHYSAQLKELANGNRVLVLTEEKRDPKSPLMRPLRLYVFGEDFSAFFRMLQETAVFIRSNPLSPEIRRKRQEYWSRRARADGGAK